MWSSSEMAMALRSLPGNPWVCAGDRGDKLWGIPLEWIARVGIFCPAGIRKALTDVVLQSMMNAKRKDVAGRTRGNPLRESQGQHAAGAMVGAVPNAGAIPERLSGQDGDGENGPGTGLVTAVRTRTRKPSMYKVLLLNDDYTPMEFVIHVLMRFFNKSQEAATRIMLHVHQKGVGVCGVYPFEVAETKVTQVMDFARKHQHPLQCTLEKD